MKTSKKTSNFFILSLIIIHFLVHLNGFAAENSQLTVRAKTESYGGFYKLANCVMIWVQKPDQTFIKTIFRGAYRRSQYCKTWDEISGNAGKTPSAKDFDGLTGATRNNHADTITAVWDCTDKEGNRVENGDYELWIEMTEDHDTSMLNHVTITIGESSQKIKAPATDYIPFLEATYGTPVSVKKSISNNKSNINLVSGSNSLSINLPFSGNYSISLFSPAGRMLSTFKGSGTRAILPISHLQLKNGVYLVKISHSGKASTLRYLKGI
jgi:hypothetical protein